MLPKLSDKTPTTIEVMQYIDFKMGVETEPDNNGCMWIEIRTMRPGLNDAFDMDIECVVALRDACNAFLENLEKE